MSILTTAEYRRLTGDYTSYDGDAEYVLGEVQKAMERYTNRRFDYDMYTEKLKTYDGAIFPSAMPVEAVTVPDPGGITVNDFGITWGGYYGIDYARNQDIYGAPALVEVSYTGGYKPEDMPVELKRINAEIARRFLSAYGSGANVSTIYNALADLPAAVTSVSVGPVSISRKVTAAQINAGSGAGGEFGGSTFDIVDQDMETKLYRWRRPDL